MNTDDSKQFCPPKPDKERLREDAKDIKSPKCITLCFENNLDKAVNVTLLNKTRTIDRKSCEEIQTGLKQEDFPEKYDLKKFKKTIEFKLPDSIQSIQAEFSLSFALDPITYALVDKKENTSCAKCLQEEEKEKFKDELCLNGLAIVVGSIKLDVLKKKAPYSTLTLSINPHDPKDIEPKDVKESLKPCP